MRASAAFRPEPASAMSPLRRLPAGPSARCATATGLKFSSIARGWKELWILWARLVKYFQRQRARARLTPAARVQISLRILKCPPTRACGLRWSRRVAASGAAASTMLIGLSENWRKQSEALHDHLTQLW